MFFFFSLGGVFWHKIAQFRQGGIIPKNFPKHFSKNFSKHSVTHFLFVPHFYVCKNFFTAGTFSFFLVYKK